MLIALYRGTEHSCVNLQYSVQQAYISMSSVFRDMTPCSRLRVPEEHVTNEYLCLLPTPRWYLDGLFFDAENGGEMPV
jgi:hypothetical protein